MGVFAEVAERVLEPVEAGRNDAPTRPLPGLTDLLMAISKAIDLLEGKPLRSGMKVAVIAGSIGKLMEMSAREVTTIVYAGLLHDIGLSRIVCDIYPHLPPNISEKQIFQMHALLNARIVGTPHERPFSPELDHLLQQHPLAARDLVAQLHLSDDVADLIAAHHELCDGSGYPFGLGEDHIPLGARILAFADVVEGVLAEGVSGLTTRRHALESFLEIKTAGKFDPQVVDVFKRLIDEHDDFLRGLGLLEVEKMLRRLLPERAMPLSGADLHNVISVMGGLSDAMMPMYKGGRAGAVAELAVHLARSLGIHREQCGELALAAMLMDIGHLATPIGLLMRPAVLTAEERLIVQDHSLMTQEVLKGIPGFENIALWAGEHQERMNGKGYPGNKKGYEISVGGRILALIDVFDALTHQRPHRRHAHAPMDALPIIGQGRMTLFDTQLVTQLRQVVLATEFVVG